MMRKFENGDDQQFQHHKQNLSP